VKIIDDLRKNGLVIATRNNKKTEEFRRLLEPYGIAVTSLNDHPVEGEALEDAPDFRGNARKKALFAYHHLGRPVLADDSGLVVDALGGEPGVMSARYGGEGLDDAGRRAFLLRRLASTPPVERTGRFVCVLALCIDEEQIFYFLGECEGEILTEERGSGGFGYDPLFLDRSSMKSFAELSPDEKDAISHRGRALRQFLHALEERR